MRNPNETTRFAIPPSPSCHPAFVHAKSVQASFDHAQSLLVTTKLLISVRNTEEAAVVRRSGVDWIDLKEPRAGALGRPSLSEAVAVAELLKGHPQRSAALGELWDLDEQIAFDFAPLFPVLKVGLSRVGSGDLNEPNWQSRFESLATKLRERGSELIPVAYADWSICGAPTVPEIQQVARQVGASHMLIDTFVKDSRGLLNWLSLDDLQQVIEAAREFNCGIVLAGSLKIADAPQLLMLHPAALAVRGAVCHSDVTTAPHVQSRTTSIDSSKVELWRRSI